mmetsp:Transcript_2295/g.7517  ORF Transcript_2295/g.7517 Transcript_2295/m.7517 type:complete len:246 (+) Transcript_2295:53-790(+)
MLSASLFALAANRAEVSTGNLRGDNKFDNLKANWDKSVSIGDFKTTVKAKYDYNANRDFLKEVSISGDLKQADNADDIAVGYELTRDFASRNTNVRLTASSHGYSVSAEYDPEEQLREVGVAREVDVGDYKVDLQPTWLVKAKAARVKLMSAINDGKDRLSAQFDYDVDGQQAKDVELSFARTLEEGKVLSASFKPDKSNLEVSLEDSTFEAGATWTATANVPLDSDPSNILDAARVTLKRSWGW